jgi:hypothetical protein
VFLSRKTERRTVMKRSIIFAIAGCFVVGAAWAVPPTHSPHHAGPGPMPAKHHHGVGHGPHGAPLHHHTFRRGVPPPNMRGWRRGPAPHPHYRSGWYGDIWYDAYGYPYYGPAVVTPAPTVVTPAPVVVTPAPAVVTPAPVVVQPAPVAVPPPPPPPPPRPAVVVPAQQVVY